MSLGWIVPYPARRSRGGRPGADHWVRQNPDQMISRLIRRFTELGYEVELKKVSITNNLGIVVTRETGSSGGNSFEGATNVWLTANIDGDWKIMGTFFRDVKSDQ